MQVGRTFPFLFLIALFPAIAQANQADDTTITIIGQTAGVTPFISQLSLTASATDVLRSVQFTVAPKPGSVIRPLSGTYGASYLLERGYLQPTTGEIFLPVYGLYDDYSNNVQLTYQFLDGSSKEDYVTIATAAFDDTCGYNSPTVLQPRTTSTSLSYDYMLVKGRCGQFSPAVIDTDGALRWVGIQSAFDLTATFYENAVYHANGSSLYRNDLDGTLSLLHDYSDVGVTILHHNIDRGKAGLILDVTTNDWTECINLEVDAAGKVLKTWNLAEIITAAMIAGGDDPSQFVFPAPKDWFHNNGVAYNRADDSLVISSRENFLICLDYKTGAIKWILGDPTKKWHQFPSLARYALALAPGSLPPIGQHSPSITYDQDVLVFDNGFRSEVQEPAGDSRSYVSPRKYQINLETRIATEVWNYESNQSVRSPICSSVYEDAPFNYVIDYALVGGFVTETNYAQLLGLDSDGHAIFRYQYSTTNCNKAYNTTPLHLESTKFPAVGPQPLNLSTRGTISSGENELIGGFFITGNAPKEVVLRALGPSLEDAGLSGTLADPTLVLHDSSGAVIIQNDNWQTDPAAAEIAATHLAPSHPAEAATEQTLAPGSYTVVVTGKNAASGIGLIEAYDLAPEADSRLANLSTRGNVAANGAVLIGGFIVGENASDTVVLRALGPSLAAAGVEAPLGDPTITVYDKNGSVIAANDNWEDDPSAIQLAQNGLAPNDPAEAATILYLPSGSYSAVVRGAAGSTGVGLVEIYDLAAP